MPKHSKTKTKRLAFQMHPRVLEALGRDLVTNDVVAVIELVKNSYDAMASRVQVRIIRDAEAGDYIEIVDDGHGMDRARIEDVWCVVATPFRKTSPEARRGKRSRPVTGDKGLGRLSAARLGRKLEVVTHAPDEPYLRVSLDWAKLSSGDNLAKSTFELSEIDSDPEILPHGTRLKISGLSTVWTEEKIVELEENLSRLVSPFSTQKDFRIFLSTSERQQTEALEIESPSFLTKPKYAIRGHVDSDGTIHGKYEYRPISEAGPRHKSLTLGWEQIYNALNPVEKSLLDGDKAVCGPFEFELRAWDLTPDDTLEIHQRFEIAKASIRRAIHSHKGISVYRDDVLVLPKSEDARDWLGLDLRRVSRVGPRLSTSQIVGYVRITKSQNPKIEDTSDRERLVSNPAVQGFQTILKEIVALLEVERDQDRRKPEHETTDLFEELTAKELLAEMVTLAEEGAEVAEALPTVREFSRRLDGVRSALKTRFTYYSRLATVGTIAQMLIHEIRNQSTSISRVLRKIGELLKDQPDTAMEKAVSSAEASVDTLERLADRFSPLASRSFRRGKRDSVLEHSIERTLGMLDAEIQSLNVEVRWNRTSKTSVAIDPGELDSIFLNLLTNSLYWLGHSKTNRVLEFRFVLIEKGMRLRVHVDDSGPGVADDDVDRIFWPGVTRKPGGIGMGLTVASELVAEHGGKMGLTQPGRLGGATFHFDLPFKE